ncbi:MAG: MlaE family ABC transporter permease [Burkholderiales bacterium]
MASSDAVLQIDTASQGALQVRASGEWTFAGLKLNNERIKRELESLKGRKSVNWDLNGVGTLDDVGAVWLAESMQGAGSVEASQRHREILNQLTQGVQAPVEVAKFDPLAGVVRIGENTAEAGIHFRDGVILLGQLALDFSGMVRRPSTFPYKEFSAGIYRAGVTALPVTMLVGFLVGIVLTYLSALQLKRYGADLLVINIVGVGVVRELGPMLASIISAGRSGSAITAQLGVMRVTEEVEALSVMGISITSRLVLPKVLALSIALPLVAFCTDIAALAGGMLVSHFTLGIAPGAFMAALPDAVDAIHFWIGIGKSVAFGSAVAFVACHYGLRVLPNTDSLAVGVTRSVVASITCVIILDAIFAIMLRNVPA